MITLFVISAKSSADLKESQPRLNIIWKLLAFLCLKQFCAASTENVKREFSKK